EGADAEARGDGAAFEGFEPGDEGTAGSHRTNSYHGSSESNGSTPTLASAPEPLHELLAHRLAHLMVPQADAQPAAEVARSDQGTHAGVGDGVIQVQIQ